MSGEFQYQPHLQSLVGRIVEPGIADDNEIFVPSENDMLDNGNLGGTAVNQASGSKPRYARNRCVCRHSWRVFSVQPFFDVPLLIHPGASILVFLIDAPLVLGFYGHSIEVSVVAGILVLASSGVRLSDPAFPPTQWVSGALIAAGYTLPVAVLMFIIGGLSRETERFATTTDGLPSR